MENKKETLEEYKARFDKGLREATSGDLKASHTPGPWEVGTYPEEDGLAVVTGELTIALLDQSFFDNRVSVAEGEKNAALISAAPELMNALVRLIDNLDNAYGSGDLQVETKILMQRGFYALLKAKGESE
jgi:hypothetical protein